LSGLRAAPPGEGDTGGCLSPLPSRLRPALPPAVAKAKALPKPACKLSSQGKAVKAWWKKFVAVCYKNPLRLTNKGWLPRGPGPACGLGARPVEAPAAPPRASPPPLTAPTTAARAAHLPRSPGQPDPPQGPHHG
jgi:hypothetical protein